MRSQTEISLTEQQPPLLPHLPICTTQCTGKALPHSSSWAPTHPHHWVLTDCLFPCALLVQQLKTSFQLGLTQEAASKRLLSCFFQGSLSPLQVWPSIATWPRPSGTMCFLIYYSYSCIIVKNSSYNLLFILYNGLSFGCILLQMANKSFPRYM